MSGSRCSPSWSSQSSRRSLLRPRASACSTPRRESAKPGRWVRVLPAYRPGGDQPRNIARVPIRRGDEVLGQVQVKWGSGMSVGTRQARLLDTAAGQLAVATERELLRTRAMEAEVLRRTSELKSALLDAVSHDLRTPLSSIIGAAGSMLQADVDWGRGD